MSEDKRINKRDVGYSRVTLASTFFLILDKSIIIMLIICVLSIWFTLILTIHYMHKVVLKTTFNGRKLMHC